MNVCACMCVCGGRGGGGGACVHVLLQVKPSLIQEMKVIDHFCKNTDDMVFCLNSGLSFSLPSLNESNIFFQPALLGKKNCTSSASTAVPCGSVQDGSYALRKSSMLNFW